MKKRILVMVLMLFVVGVCVLSGCSKESGSGGKVLEDTGRLVAVYGTVGERHNAFLSRSFLALQQQLRKNTNGAGVKLADDSSFRRLVMEVAARELVPVLSGAWPAAGLLTAMKAHLPQDLTLEKYPSTHAAVVAVLQGLPGVSMSPVFPLALAALDKVLERCNRYPDSLEVFAGLDSLQETWPGQLTRPAERESFIGGLVLARHSFRYWAANKDWVSGLFADSLKTGIPADIILTGGGGGGNANLVNADVRGMVTGGLRGAYAGGVWGSAIPGIGTLWGAVAGGLVGAGAGGCVSSLAAGLKQAIIK
ncbi:MAG: hypothetical protein P0Y53_23360 [Candidatus Pseudobacter hemicellulosilyticus]|uniref:Uncharacterized protein n=1 Tax=Candidatus Pseudobacter hemicellulosilyticus TaxID=3121375 RepID=A0AAJ5WNY2_9BACT|nr:MAG: hypothetical protein P0Y53_23360 [Pseudobacter sp.]